MTPPTVHYFRSRKILNVCSLCWLLRQAQGQTTSDSVSEGADLYLQVSGHRTVPRRHTVGAQETRFIEWVKNCMKTSRRVNHSYICPVFFLLGLKKKKKVKQILLMTHSAVCVFSNCPLYYPMSSSQIFQILC